jgi:catechol 2,3-dioxygenase-like lactoylglutathione lyase family enzyme
VPHGLDHVVHTVRDLEKAGEFYARLGFTVGARNQHPWGTHNRIVQLKNCYIEILEVAEPEKIVPHAARSFSFGAFQRDYAESRQGLSMLLLNSGDAAADARAFEAAGMSDYEVFNFAREGKKPDGATVKLAFSLVFTRDPMSPDLGLALCQHHFPENFWNSVFQTHVNGAQRVGGVVLVASDPTRHEDFLRAYTGCEPDRDANGVVAHTGNGDIEVMRPSSYRDRFGVPAVAIGEAMMLNAMRFAVDDLAQAQALLRQSGLGHRNLDGRLIVPPEIAFGATLIFEAAKP